MLAYASQSSVSLHTVRQLRTVLVVASLESKYALVNLVRASPFGQHRKSSLPRSV